MSPDQTSILIKSILSDAEIGALISLLCRQMHSGWGMSSFLFIDDLSNNIVKKIKSIAEDTIGHKLLYLNDFYLYTDGNNQANWHIDTEMFSFNRAVNVWIPLDESLKINPIAFIKGVNDCDHSYYHSISQNGLTYEFMNLVDFNEELHPVDLIEQTRIVSENVSLGDILFLNPRRFHRTNSGLPKHAFIIKFVMAGKNGLQSQQMVPALVWPEAALFADFMDLQDDWQTAIKRLRSLLSDPMQRPVLTAGFFPERIELFRHKILELTAERRGQGHDS